MNPSDIIESTAAFFKDYFGQEGWLIEETPPSFTLFDTYTKGDEEWAYHVLPINDLVDVDQDFWIPTMKEELFRENVSEKNLCFFGVCQAPQGDSDGLVDPEAEYFFVIIYLADRNDFFGKLFDFEINTIGEFNVFEAFPELLAADFLREDVIH
jgi:hypothetical protein